MNEADATAALDPRTRLARFALRRWRLLLVTMTGFAAIAWLAWLHIPRLEDPSVEPPKVFVFVPYPGASPDDIEVQVIRPLEGEFEAVEGFESMTATARLGFASFELTFERGTPMQSAEEAVRGKLTGLRDELPDAVRDPIVRRAVSAMFTAQMVVSIVGYRADEVLADTARQLKDRLASIDGVASVKSRGVSEHAVKVHVDPARLQAHGVSLGQLTSAIRGANARVSAGELNIGSVSTVVSLEHAFRNADDVRKITLGTVAGGMSPQHTLLLRDVADVEDGLRSATERILYDGVPAVTLELRYRASEDAVAVGKRVRARLDDLSKGLPAGTSLRVVHDQAGYIEHALGRFTESLLEGVLLVMAVITLGLGLRPALVVAIVLPLAVGGAVLGLYFFDLTLEQVSISGLIVALGLLVDDAVVVTESIALLRTRGLSAARAAVLGTARVFRANNATTAVACASFIPLLTLPGETGDFVRGLPVAVISALAVSLVVAQLLTPWMSTLLLSGSDSTHPPSHPHVELENDNAEEHDSNLLFRPLKAAYRGVAPLVLRHPLTVIAGAIAALVLAVTAIPSLGVQFFPRADKPMLFVRLELPDGTRFDDTLRRTKDLVTLLRSDPSVAFTSALVGASHPQVLLSRTVHTPSSSYADVMVKLHHEDPQVVAARLRARLSGFTGARVSVEELFVGPPIAHPIALRIEGDDHAVLADQASRVTDLLHKIPGTLNVAHTLSSTLPLAQLELEEGRMTALSAQSAALGLAARTLYGRDPITHFYSNADRVDVIIEPHDAKSGPQVFSLDQVPVASANGVRLQAGAFAQARLGSAPAELKRYNRRRMVEISADLDSSTYTSRVLKKLSPQLAALRLPTGYTLSVVGEQAESQKSFRGLGEATIAALLLVFVLLVYLFDSMTEAVVVLAAVPFALIGGVSALYVAGIPFGFMSFLGLVALIGVYVNHKIYYVDRVHELRSRGYGYEEALYQAGLDRMRPVTLTALTAILGLLPLTMTGGPQWAAFGWVNILGIFSSIPLSLLLLPALLLATHRLRTGWAQSRTVVTA